MPKKEAPYSVTKLWIKMMHMYREEACQEIEDYVQRRMKAAMKKAKNEA